MSQATLPHPDSPADDVRWRSALSRIQLGALVVGLAGLGLCCLGYFVDRRQFFHSYLAAFMLWTGVALGSLAMSALHNLVGGRWGRVIRRPMESGAASLPLMALFFIPIALGLHDLYGWAHEGAHFSGPHKKAWFQVGFFIARAAVYFGVWTLLAFLLNTCAASREKRQDDASARRLSAFSGPAILLYAATMTLASFDWVMSLDIEWYSSIFGFLFIAAQGLSTLAFCIAVMALLSRIPPVSRIVKPQDFQDLGSLMFAFVMLWAYMSFSQYLIIWSGNLKEEVPFYTARIAGAWRYVALSLIIIHFSAPFLLLLSRSIKRNPMSVGFLALLIIVMRFIDLVWLIEPGHLGAGVLSHWQDIAAPLGIGGVWLAFVIWRLKACPILSSQLEPAEERHHG